jgi:hypothetical protein
MRTSHTTPSNVIRAALAAAKQGKTVRFIYTDRKPAPGALTLTVREASDLMLQLDEHSYVTCCA